MKHVLIGLAAAVILTNVRCTGRRAEGLPFATGSWRVVEAQVAALTLLTDTARPAPAIEARLRAYRGVVYDFGVDGSVTRTAGTRRETGRWLPDRDSMLVLQYTGAPPEAWQTTAADDDTLRVVSRAGLVLKFTLVRE